MTAPVAPMEARCEHCHDTGSLSKQMDADLDCHYCDATEKRRKLRTHLSKFTGWPDNDTAAWAAYLFAQRQAAPVAPQPAEQAPVAWWRYSYIDEDGSHDLDMYYGEDPNKHYTPNAHPWNALYAAPQLEAQQAGDVALSEQAVCDMVREHGLLTDKGVRLASNGDFVSLNLTAITAIVNCAIAQGGKA